VAVDQLIQGKKPYVKPLLNSLTVSEAALLVQRSESKRQNNGGAFALAGTHHILRVERYTAELLEVVPPLQSKGFSLGWSPGFEGEPVLEIRAAVQTHGSPAEYSLLADLRSSRFGTKVVWDRIKRAYDAAPVSVVVLCRPESIVLAPASPELAECWESKQPLQASELAALLNSFIDLCSAFRRSRLVEGITRLRTP
jgi:hypothetical protein